MAEAPTTNYVPLRVRSNYSLLTGAATVEALVARAARLGLSALALTDEANLYGAVRFMTAARAAGVRPVLGAILRGTAGADPPGEAVLLVQDREGYANLCRLITQRHLASDFRLAAAIAERRRGLLVLTPDPDLAAALRPALDPAQLKLELVRPAASQQHERRVRAAAIRLDLELVATVAVHFAVPADFELFAVLNAVRQNRLLAEVAPELQPARAGYLRPPAEMAALFADAPAALAASVRLAAGCAFDLLGQAPVFPQVAGDGVAQLRQQAQAGAVARYGTGAAGAVQERLERELALIRQKGFADYFLVVADIVAYARSLGTPVAGRGSGASSLVAYCLGITNVDPLRYNLPFERFLNEGRRDFPDLDVDFCWRRRDDVLAYIYRKYGAAHVAMIATHATLQPRLAFRVIAKALGLAPEAIGKVLAQLHADLPPARWHELPAAPDVVARALRLAGRGAGFPHHVSVHAGGVVITPDALNGHVPLQRAAKGVTITQFEKDAVAAVGLVKLDVLGNRGLSLVAEAIALAPAADRGGLDPETIPETDPPTARLLAAGDAIGINQLESPAMRRLLRQLRPAGTADVMRALGLIRPGAASLGMKAAFIRRARGGEPVPPLAPRLDDILRGSHGIMLFEDDALLVAGALAGLPPAAADQFRRAVTKSQSVAERQELSATFLDRCRANGVDVALAADLWTQMAKFNSYSFCRAHAASYARLAWAAAYLKAHQPAAFWVAALNNNQGLYEKWVYVEELKRGGLRALPPCVNRAADEFTLEPGGIRIGLGQVAGLSRASRADLFRHRPFRTLAELLTRTRLPRAAVERLIRAGALDTFGEGRSQLLLALASQFDQLAAWRGPAALFAPPAPPASALRLPPLTPAQQARDEWELLGLSTGPHPLAPFRPLLAARGFATSGALAERPGRPVKLAGLLAAARTVAARDPAADGRRRGAADQRCFLTLSDEDGLFEATLNPDVFARCRRRLVTDGPRFLWLDGAPELQYDAVAVTVRQLGALLALLNPGQHQERRRVAS